MNQSVADRFDRCVRTHPDALAIRTSARSLTYRELDFAANRVARLLLAESGEAPEPVALYLPDVADATIAMLGVLKAGKFFVPLDTSGPEARNRLILEDSGSSLLLASAEAANLAVSLTRSLARVLRVDQVLDGDGVSAGSVQLPLVLPDDLAYILYTSGSTGTPKGVVQTHKNHLHFTMKAINGPHISRHDRLTVLSTLTHAAAISDILTGLLCGAAIFPYDVHGSGLAGLTRWIVENEITVCHMVPTLFRRVATSLPPKAEFPKLRLIKLSGEPANRHDVELFRTHFPQHTMLFNTLGSTEIHSLRRYFMDHESEFPGSVLPVGYELPDTRIVLVDDSGKEVAEGEVGEIIVVSPFISPGYWRRPDLTEATFSVDPENPDNRIYRTGDLGRMLEGGCLVHLGRKDHQVQIRGNRVEMAEVEAALLDLPAVREAAVVARPDERGELRLAAYLVARDGHELRFYEVRASLSERLPGYMVPSWYIVLDSLPITATGKVDRLALPEPPREQTRGSGGLVEPRDEIERDLLDIWEKLLKTGPIGVADDFFDVGGDSLLAIQLLLAIEERFGREIPQAALLERTTVAGLAGLLRRDESQVSFSPLVPIQPNGSRLPLYCVHGLGGGVLHYRLLASLLGSNQPVFGVHAQEPSTCGTASIEEMASRHVRAIKELQQSGPYHLCGYSAGGAWAFEIARQLSERGDAVGLLALLDTPCPGRSKLLPAAARFRYHVSRATAMRLGEALPYVMGRLATIGQRARGRVSGLTGSWEGTSGQRLPHSVRAVDGATRMAYESYRPSIYRGKITLFLTGDDSVYATRFEDDPRLAWREFTDRDLEICDVPGDHGDIMSEPNVRALASGMAKYLGEAQGLVEERREETVRVATLPHQ